MTHLESLMRKNMGYGFATQYCLADDSWNSLISFYNYYDQVFPGQNVEANLYVVFHDASGYEILSHEQVVPPGDVVQINAHELGVKSSGIVAVTAIALADIHKLASGKFKINSTIPTSFYITWEHTGKSRDMMHEWELVSCLPGNSVTHHIGLSYSQYLCNPGLVLTNPTIATTQPGYDRLVLRTCETKEPLHVASIPRLPPMGSRIVELSDFFPGIDSLLEKHDRLVVDFTTCQLAAPLTIEWHSEGDFHIHHL